MTGESYIGQSKDIDYRFKEHIYHSKSYIDQAIKYYGIDNFEFRILQICNPEELDELEDYYIQYFYSNIPFCGYNICRGGQYINKNGELNPNSKLSEQDVYDIRESYKNHLPKYQVYENYKTKISKKYFSSVW